MPPVLELCRTWFSEHFLAPSQVDRRLSQRTVFHDSLLVADSGGCVYHASGRDQNAGGLGAIVCGDLGIGEKVLVHLEGRKVRALVLHRNGYRYGLKFLDGNAGAPMQAMGP